MESRGVFLEWYRFNIDLSVNPLNHHKCPETRRLRDAHGH